MTDSQYCHGSATLIAQAIRQQIFDELQLTASAGIAPIKFLAKIASDLNKPNGQFVITPQRLPEFVLSLPLKKFRGWQSHGAKVIRYGIGNVCGCATL